MAQSDNNRQRIIDQGKVVSAPVLFTCMHHIVFHACECIDSRFLEPACRDANYPARVARRKPITVGKKNAGNCGKWNHNAILAACSLYIIDQLAETVTTCRNRLLPIVTDAYDAFRKTTLPDLVRRALVFFLTKYALKGCVLTYRRAGDRPTPLNEWSYLNRMLLKRRDITYIRFAMEARPN